MKKILLLSLAVIALLSANSCVKDDLYGAPSISGIQNTIAYSEADAVTVTATVSSLVGVESASLFYQAGSGAYSNVPMSGSGTMSAVIPSFAMGTKVNYYIEAASKTGETTKSPVVSYTVGEVPVDYTGLILNELNGNDKFIEIYNAGDHDIYMGGVYIEKDGSKNWDAPNENLKKGEYWLLYSEDVVISGEAQEGYDEDYVFHSGLSAKKAVRIQLFDPKGKSLDDFNVPNHDGTKVPGSYGRNANGKWYIQDATPKAPNKESSQPVPEGWFAK